MEGKYAVRNDTNNLYDSLIDAPNSIDHPDIRWYSLDVYRCLDRIICNVGGGAKIERSGDNVPQLIKTGIGGNMTFSRGIGVFIPKRDQRITSQLTNYMDQQSRIRA